VQALVALPGRVGPWTADMAELPASALGKPLD
jgi:3-methyladenine DNA glycosylase/8-oxoguanine DNA glycosylase